MNHFEIVFPHHSVETKNHSSGRLIYGVYPYNASRIYRLYPMQLDVEIRAPESVLLMLLTFIAMALALFLFCLLTNPVPEVKEPAPKKVSSQAGKKKKKNRLQIDWSILKVSKVKLDELSKIEMCKNPGSEAPTIQVDPSTPFTSKTGGGKTEVKQIKKKGNLSDAVKAVRSGLKSKLKQRSSASRRSKQ